MEAKDDYRYKNVREIYADVRLIFTNAMTYNDEKNDIHQMAKTLLEKFEEKWLQLLPKIVEEVTGFQIVVLFVEIWVIQVFADLLIEKPACHCKFKFSQGLKVTCWSTCFTIGALCGQETRQKEEEAQVIVNMQSVQEANIARLAKDTHTEVDIFGSGFKRLHH